MERFIKMRLLLPQARNVKMSYNLDFKLTEEVDWDKVEPLEVRVSKPKVVYVNTKFADRSVIGDYCFLLHCMLGDKMILGRYVTCSDYTVVGNLAEFGDATEFGYGAEFGDGAEFGYGAEFGGDAEFGSGAEFGGDAEFGNRCTIFEYNNKAKMYVPVPIEEHLKR